MHVKKERHLQWFYSIINHLGCSSLNSIFVIIVDYSPTSLIILHEWIKRQDKDIKMWTDWSCCNPPSRLTDETTHENWRKWQNWLSHLLVGRFARSVNGRQLATNFKLITQSRLNPFLEWTVICTVSAIVRNGRTWGTGYGKANIERMKK